MKRHPIMEYVIPAAIAHFLVWINASELCKRKTTMFRDKDNEITVKCGCFRGKVDEFLEKVTQTHKDTKYALVYRAAVGVAKLQIDLSPEQTAQSWDELVIGELFGEE